MKTLLIIIALIILSSSFFKKKKVQSIPKEQEVDFDAYLEEQEQRQSWATPQKASSYTNITNKVEDIKHKSDNKQGQVKKKKFDVKSAIIYSSIMERPYKY
ncbi:MAG: hypothetical protein Q4Q06_00435 [Bacteroidota bacterium]|nr:hypothetical protein [Bacteroidota bacterium]